MSERPDAIRKYIAPSPRPVIVNRTKVLTSLTSFGSRVTSGRNAEQAAHELGLREQLLGIALVDDASLVEHDDVARQPAHDSEVLLDEQYRRQLGQPLERAGDVGDERGRESLRRLVDEQQAVVVEQCSPDR